MSDSSESPTLPCTLGQNPQLEVFCQTFDFLVGAVYFMLILMSLRLLLFKIWREQERRWQIFFHGFLFLACLCRCVYMFVLPFRLSGPSYHLILNTLPSFFFFSAYLVFLFFWAELYHHNTGKMIYFRTQYVLLNVFMYSATITLYILDSKLFPYYCDEDGDCRDNFLDLNPVQIATHMFTALFYLILAFGYAFYGTQLFNKFWRLPTGNAQKRDDQRVLLFKLGSITMLVTVFFIVRFIVIILWVTQRWATVWWFDAVYFFLLEAMPVSMLFYLFVLSSASSTAPHPLTDETKSTGNEKPISTSISKTSILTRTLSGSEVTPLLAPHASIQVQDPRTEL